MPSFRVNKTKNYTVMSNYHLKDKRLSLKAKGLLSLMLSLPENWDYSVKGLVSLCKEGSSSVETGLKELKKYGYLSLDKIPPSKTESGRFEYIYNIYECPEDKQDHEILGVEKQVVENLGLEILGVENHPLNKDTKELNTKELNTKESIIKKSYQSILYTENEIKEQINYKQFNDDRLDEIVLIIKEILNSSKDFIKISGEEKNIEVVKGVFKKLDSFHIEYVLHCLDTNKTEIKNIKSYMIACLYNSVFTINSYYTAKVRYDLGQ